LADNLGFLIFEARRPPPKFCAGECMNFRSRNDIRRHVRPSSDGISVARAIRRAIRRRSWTMPRKPRLFEPNVAYHVFNRRTDGQVLFPTTRSRDEFIDLLEEGRNGYQLAICLYCLMDTHWHLGIWVRDAREAATVGNFLRWLSARHAIRLRIATGTRGYGHVYQDRYKSKPTTSIAHYLTLSRYIEANPLEAGLVERAEHWRWSSLAERLSGRRRVIVDGPVVLPSNWLEIVNARAQFDDYLSIA
jgi:REP-associated tyrosine transposase